MTHDRTVSVPFFDCDQHYYEARDAFTRHMDPALARRGVQWITINGRERVMAGDRIWRGVVPNPTFDPIARPGSIEDYFRGRNPMRSPKDNIFGDLDPLDSHPEYQTRSVRAGVLAEQGAQGALLFPTQGMGIEEALWRDPEALHATLHAFNLWLDEDWGFDRGDYLYAAPMLSLVDPDACLRELEFVAERGARVVCLRPGPVIGPNGGRSPGDPCFDDIWRCAADANIAVAYHDAHVADHYAQAWGETTERGFVNSPFVNFITDGGPILETIAALILHGVFDRHPTLRVATIELGSGWVPELLRRLDKRFKVNPWQFQRDPLETFRDRMWVAPFFEDDIHGLIDLHNIDRVVMGSDWPHAEGLTRPIDFALELEELSPPEVRTVMRDNGLELALGRALT